KAALAPQVRSAHPATADQWRSPCVVPQLRRWYCPACFLRGPATDASAENRERLARGPTSILQINQSRSDRPRTSPQDCPAPPCAIEPRQRLPLPDRRSANRAQQVRDLLRL